MPLKSLLMWLATGTIAAGIAGWIAAQIHLTGHAPVGLVSAGAGALLGFALAWLAVLAGIRCKRQLAIGTLLLATLAVVAEHAWLYRDFRRQWEEAREKSTTVAMFRSERPPGPDMYFAHEWNPALWISDGAIIIVAAVGTVILLRRNAGDFGAVVDTQSINSKS
jgi:hypothetical protein